jgi:cobalt-precorrin 5A hydrolase
MTAARSRSMEPAPALRRGIAMIAITAPGAATALRLSRALARVSTYIPNRFLPAAPERARPAARGDPRVTPYSEPVASLIRELFATSEALILVMAAGAAVRMLAPLLADKFHDPAVVVIDDAGRFAISLVSGHHGGANKLAERVAEALDGVAVVTTASEIAGVPAADLIGRDLGWAIEPGSDLKGVSAALVNGELVGVVQEIGPRSWIPVPRPSNLIEFGTLDELVDARPAAAIIVSDRLVRPADLTAAVYRPPVLVLGIGCVRGAKDAEIEALVGATLREAGRSPLSVVGVATIDLKAREPGLVAFCERHCWPMMTFSAAELEETAGDWHRSHVVRRAVGTSGVAEPAALLGARASVLLARKVKTARVTLAIASRET